MNTLVRVTLLVGILGCLPGCESETRIRGEIALRPSGRTVDVPAGVARESLAALRRLRGGKLFQCFNRSSALHAKKEDFKHQVKELGAGVGGWKRFGAQCVTMLPTVAALGYLSQYGLEGFELQEVQRNVRRVYILSWLVGLLMFTSSKRYAYHCLFSEDPHYVDDKQGESIGCWRAFKFYVAQSLSRYGPLFLPREYGTPLEVLSLIATYPCLCGGNGIQSAMERWFGIIAVRKTRMRMAEAVERFLRKAGQQGGRRRWGFLP
mmetsp:Transcript_6892/g.13638  ORF Transcript_6892/g.13638 Transcript_6892/m.13638 type:complete len:264 (-) Transcript_6892:198-989(-)